MSESKDRLPPHDELAESALLGCVILEPKLMADLRTQTTTELFYVTKNQMIWDAMCQIVDGGGKLDSVTLTMQLAKDKILEQIGVDYLGKLQDFTPSSLNWPTYLDAIRELFVLRSIIRFSTEFAGRAYDKSNASSSLLDSFEQGIAAIRAGVNPGRDIADNSAIHRQLMEEYRDAMDRKTMPGIQTGFIDIDRLIGGMKPQDLVVVAGSPSSGKTSLVLNIAQHAVFESGVKVGILSLETSAKKLMHRNNCSVARVNGGRLMTGNPIQQDMTRLSENLARLSKTHKNFIISDRGGLTAHQATSLFRRMHQLGARMFILDYIQLLRIEGRSTNRNEEMGKISNVMKQIAKELDCPVIVISSINRDSQKENRAPKLSDLRESGQLEFDADMAFLLHPQDDGNDFRTVEVNVAKNKDGETGKATLTFVPPEMRFENASRVSDNDVPHNHANI